MEVQIISNTVQKFNGESYYLCGYYYQRKGRRLHRTVWEYHNGPIPSGYHVHHVDGDRSNNSIDNLALKEAHEHLSDHMNTPERKEHSAKAVETAREAACKWHSSNAGKVWHSKMAKESWQDRPMQIYSCQHCGKEYQSRTTNHNGTRFCSANCKAAHRRESGVDNVQKICPVCGDNFITNKYSGIICCSRECARIRRWGK